MKRLWFLLCSYLLLVSSFSFAEDVGIVNLKVEYEATPLGLDVAKPRFSWQMTSSTHRIGQQQTAYQVEVSGPSGKIVWNSGKINSEISLNIEYHGEDLHPSTRYEWTVYVWDQNRKKHAAQSWFETGLMSAAADHRSWGGAKWIGGGDDDLVFYSHYLPVFKIDFAVQLDQASFTSKASFIYGANDIRLMQQFKNLYQIKSGKDQSYIRIEFDISSLMTGGLAQLNIYRAGYHPADRTDKPLRSFSIPASIVNNENKFEAHAVHISTELGFTQLWIDGTGKENFIGDLSLNPLGVGGDFIAFPVVGDIGFAVDQGKATFSALYVRNFRSPSSTLFHEKNHPDLNESIFSSFKDNISVSGDRYVVTSGGSPVLLMANPSRNGTPMLRTEFRTSAKKIVKARLYVTARGIYKVYLNGKLVGDDFFNPGLSQYPKTHFYQTYDVTDQLVEGENAMGAMLAEGWWSGGATYMGRFWNFFGDRQSLLAKLLVSYEDGSETVVVTNPETWLYYNNGPVVYGSFFQGEVYDATKEKAIEGWSTTSYDDSNWKHAAEVSLESTVSREETDRQFNVPQVADYSKSKVVSQIGPPVKAFTTLTARSMEEVRPQVFVYDMGQNMVGIPSIKISGMQPGSKVYLRYAEVKYPDMPEYGDNAGMIMLENIRAAMAQDIYICRGGEELIQSRFTFHGFRYIEITGIDRALPVEAVNGIVLSSIREMSSAYECSNPKVNQLWSNIKWSTLGNFLSIPTDCPQRNERLGWSGDISVFSGTATYMSDVSQFLRRHMQAMRDVQREDGRFSDVAPMGAGFGGVLWGSAGLTVAWENYLQHGDKRLLEEHYEAMKGYVKYIVERNIDPATKLLIQEHPQSWANLGDWLGPEQEKNDNTLLWEAYFIYDLEIMTRAASVLQKEEDRREFQTLYDQRRKFFNEVYIDPKTKKTVHSGFRQHKMVSWKAGDVMDTQTSYVLPLAFGLVDQDRKDGFVKNMIASIEGSRYADNGTACPPYSLMTGFIGTAWVNKSLSDAGRADVAYKLLQQTSYPSWLYSVDQGATTIWERLDSYTHKNGFGGNNRMNSFNHYSFGAVGAWLMAYSVGIGRDEASPGFKHFILQPEPDPTGQITFAKGHYDSMYGRIGSSWQRSDDFDTYSFIIPANTTATLYLPSSPDNNIFVNGKAAKDSRYVRYNGTTGNKRKFELSSGQYQFKVKR